MNRNATPRLRRITLCLIGLAILFLIHVSPLAVRAQSSSSGSLTGVVQDPNGASLPGVNIVLKNVGTGATRTVTTNDEGRWTMAALPVGTYELTYELAGFKKRVREQVEVEASVPRTLEDKLEVGDVGATINIVEGAALVTPDTATTFRQLSAEELVSVPTSTRSFTQLLSTEAGVNTELSPVLTNGNGNQSPAVNGTRLSLLRRL